MSPTQTKAVKYLIFGPDGDITDRIEQLWKSAQEQPKWQATITPAPPFCPDCTRTAEQGVCDGCENTLFLPGPNVPLEPKNEDAKKLWAQRIRDDIMKLARKGPLGAASVSKKTTDN